MAGDAGVEGLDCGQGCFGALGDVSIVCLDIDYVELIGFWGSSAIAGSLWGTSVACGRNDVRFVQHAPLRRRRKLRGRLPQQPPGP